MTQAVPLLLCLAVVGQTGAEGKPYAEGRFQGRIAYSADGNHNDPDDWAASPVALAILAGAGVKDRLVHFDYNCILPQTDPAWEKTHADSVLGAAERYGFDRSRFFDCRQQLDAAVGSIARAINDSSAANPLYFIIAGPMEVPYRGIEKSDPARRQFVYCISHSRWNDGFASKYKFTFSKRSVIEQDVHWVQIADQNRLLSCGRYGRPSPPEEFKPYFWMRDARDPNVRFLWERLVVSTRPDPSDAGMAWFLVTGDEECDPAKLKLLLDDRQPLPPVTARKQVRIEAENFRHFEGFVLEDRNDRQASHRLNVKLAGGSAGRIRTPFDEPFTRDAGRYDVDIRCLGEPAGQARFRFLVNDTPAGQEWQAATAGGQWATHTLADLAVKRGDDLTVEARMEGQGIVRLDYVQLRSTGKTAAGLKFERHRIDLLEGDYFGCAVGRLGAGQGLDFVLGGSRGVKQLLWYEHPDWKKHVIAEGVYTCNDGQGRFTPHIIGQESGVGIHDGIVADINGDGKPDVIGKNAIYRQESPPHQINPTNVDWWENRN